MTFAWWTTPMGFTITCGVQVVDVGGYEPFVWRCDWRVACFASPTDTAHLSLRRLFVFHVRRFTNPLSGDAFGGSLVWTLNHLFVCRRRSCALNSTMPIMVGRPHYTIGNGTVPGRRVLVRKLVQ